MSVDYLEEVTNRNCVLEAESLILSHDYAQVVGKLPEEDYRCDLPLFESCLLSRRKVRHARYETTRSWRGWFEDRYGISLAASQITRARLRGGEFETGAVACCFALGLLSSFKTAAHRNQSWASFVLCYALCRWSLNTALRLLRPPLCSSGRVLSLRRQKR